MSKRSLPFIENFISRYVGESRSATDKSAIVQLKQAIQVSLFFVLVFYLAGLFQKEDYGDVCWIAMQLLGSDSRLFIHEYLNEFGSNKRRCVEVSCIYLMILLSSSF